MLFRSVNLCLCIILAALVYAHSSGLPAGVVPFPIGNDALDYQKTLPIFRDLAIAREISTHDRNGGNDNGFSNKAEFIRRDMGWGTVLVDVEGPGCIYSFWYSWPNNPRDPQFIEHFWAKSLGNIRINFSRQSLPKIDLPLRELVGFYPHIFPLALNAAESNGGYITYAPMPFKRGIKVTVEGSGMPLFFYHAWLHTYPYGTRVDTYNGLDFIDPEITRKLSGPAGPIPGDRLRRVVDVDLAPGAEREIMSLDGGGVIRSIRMLLPEDDTALRSLRLQIRWDGETRPSVDAPLSLLYALENRFSTKPAQSDDNAPLTGPILGHDEDGYYYFNMPMPFNDKASLALLNDGGKPVKIEALLVELDSGKLDGVGTEAGYFKTHFNSSNDLKPNRDYSLAHLKGRGHIVGTVLAVEDTYETFLEGDERIYVDGSRSPLIMGDATETYFNGSWYFWGRAFSCPFHGAPTYRKYKTKPGPKVDITMYRFHVTDLVPYRSEARFTIQHGGVNEVPGNYRSLVFYYGVPEKILAKSDAVNMSAGGSLDDHDFSQEGYPAELESKAGFFEGERDGNWLGELQKPEWRSPMLWNIKMTKKSIFARPRKNSPDRKTFFVRMDSKPYEFTVKVDAQNRGVMLRRLFDQSIPDQKAAIEVNGRKAGVWYNAGRNRYKRWAEDDYMIGPWLTSGENKLRIRVIPISPIFSSCEYQIFSLSVK